MSVATMAAAWKGSRHGGTELLMLLAIADCADDEGRAYPSVRTLAKKCRMKTRNANYILSALRDSGELDVRVGQGPYGTNLYRVNLQALQSGAGVQRSAGGTAMQCTPPAKDCANPLQHSADKPSKKHQKKKEPESLPELPEWLPLESWRAFDEKRREMNKPMTPRAAKMMLKHLANLRDQGIDIEAALDQSTRNGWQDVYAPKTQKQQPVKPAACAWEGAL